MQVVTVLLGFHYALSACGREGGRGGRSWAYALLVGLGAFAVLLMALLASHTMFVLTGQTSRQILKRVRARSAASRGRRQPQQQEQEQEEGQQQRSGEGATNGAAGGGTGAERGEGAGRGGVGGGGDRVGEGAGGGVVPVAGSSGAGAGAGAGMGVDPWRLAQPLTPGRVAQNACWLLCGLRPAWLLAGGWAQRGNAWVARAVHNEYYSCCS
ncbi:hypothetical protein HYH03_005849 [Edaphochlamys debaryana]|uniref:Uncharacterized protein n=1 Tax=Edaphochlamys debaryana TaxID=47281 RepID=A0A835Y7M6_9CHLO|nr:hypothetical protein HYH03_005849 [Edaphochlamys debaryana]|eukprot:KAG2496253.1 hypothetical protein HYH03_005849 [Edaphochlamys debaryana]